MTSLAFIILVFVAVGTFFLFIHMLMGSFLRPSRPDSEKLSIYECGEPTVGSAWMQFDIRYYVVALLFVIFDVEVAFFFPWAVVFGSLNVVARHQEGVEWTTTEKEAKVNLTNNLPSVGKNDVKAEITPETARSWAWVAFADILVFFGVLMVGFAYLWRRGDIDWVRSTASERIPGERTEELPIRQYRELVAGAK